MLIAEHLKKRYKEREVVRDFSLLIHPGECVGLLGPNGAGKTTCFYMIVGLVGVDGGRIRLDRDDITTMPMHSRARLGIGYLPQEASIFRTLTVEENLMAVLELRPGMKRDERRRACQQLMADLQIEHIHQSKGQSLSGGERRRVEIARALAAKPRYMLLDEPFAGVDPISVAEIQNIVAHLKDRGIGVLVTDHNVQETLGIVDRAYILNAGEVMAHGKPKDIVEDKRVREVYLGERFKLNSGN